MHEVRITSVPPPHLLLFYTPPPLLLWQFMGDIIAYLLHPPTPPRLVLALVMVSFGGECILSCTAAAIRCIALPHLHLTRVPLFSTLQLYISFEFPWQRKTFLWCIDGSEVLYLALCLLCLAVQSLFWASHPLEQLLNHPLLPSTIHHHTFLSPAPIGRHAYSIIIFLQKPICHDYYICCWKKSQFLIKYHYESLVVAYFVECSPDANLVAWLSPAHPFYQLLSAARLLFS